MSTHRGFTSAMGRSPPEGRIRRRRRGTDGLISLGRRFRPRFDLMEDRTLLSTFLVGNTADVGPGSLRQAILDSNAATGGSNTIDFAIPGTGVQTIAPASPLPAITQSVLFDATTQPGFATTPLIALRGQTPGSTGPLVISGGNLTIRGLAVDSLAVAPTADDRLLAVVHSRGMTTNLSLLGPSGQVVVKSDAVSSQDPDNVIDEHLAAGDYLLAVASAGGQGAYTLTTIVTPATAPLSSDPSGLAAIRRRDRRRQWRRTHRPRHRKLR